jgi:hypothetical protein
MIIFSSGNSFNVVKKRGGLDEEDNGVINDFSYPPKRSMGLCRH